MSSSELKSAIASLKTELERIQTQCSDALEAIELDKTHRLIQVSIPDVRVQRLIMEIQMLRGAELEDVQDDN